MLRDVIGMKAGNYFRVGFHVSHYIEADIPTWIGCLYNTGAFQSIDVTPEDKYTEFYLTFKGQTSMDFSAPQDVGGFILQTIQACSGVDTMGYTGMDQVVVDAPPGFQQPYQGVPQGGDPNAPKCDFSKQSLADYLKCATGAGSSTVLLLGIGLGALALFAVGRAAGR
jgi:hypothetical protein